MGRFLGEISSDEKVKGGDCDAAGGNCRPSDAVGKRPNRKPCDTGRETNQRCYPFRQTSRERLGADKILNRGNEINEKQEKRCPCRRNVIVKDALHVTHGALGGSTDQSFVQSEAEQQGGDDGENRECAFHKTQLIRLPRWSQTAIERRR